jgi:hypothetical protein
MVENRRDLGWFGVLVGMIALVVLVLGILLALGARTIGWLRQPSAEATAQPAPTASPIAAQIIATLESERVESATPVLATPTPRAGAEAALQGGMAQAPDLAAYLRDGETVQVEFTSGLSLAGLVQIEQGALDILNPLGAAIDLGEVAVLVTDDDERLVPAEFGIAATVVTPGPTLAVASSPPTNTIAMLDTALPANGSAATAPGVAITIGDDTAVSVILDQYPEGTLFRATLQTGEEVLAIKQNRLKLVRVDRAGGEAGKTIVPLWMIVSLAVAS